MSGRRAWFKHDAWFLADDKIRELGHEFGPAGPLVASALMQLAKRQQSSGTVTVRWSYLAEHAFVSKRGAIQKIVALAAELGFVSIEREDAREVVLSLPKWEEIQGAGVSGAERTAKWRASQRDDDLPNGDGPVTSRDDHGNGAVTSPSRAIAQEVERDKEPNGSSRRALRTEQAKANEDDIRLCRLLAELAKTRNPKFKIKSQTAWLRSMRLTREQDANAPADTERLVRWLFTDTGRDAMFWADVIQSPANLREHYPQLWAKMTAAPGLRAVPDVESSEAMLRRRGAA